MASFFAGADTVCVDSFWSAAIDPYHGTFTTLFVGAVLLGPAGRIPYRLPVPERDMARQLSNLPLGGLKQAVAAARHALRFVDRIRSEHNTGTPPCLLLLWSGPRTGSGYLPILRKASAAKSSAQRVAVNAL